MTDKKVEVTEPIYSKDPKENEYIKERLQAAIKAVIDQQMATNKPKQATETFERLQEEGFTAEESYNLMAQLVSMEAAELFAGTGQIDMLRYIAALEKLPEPFAKPRIEETED